MALNKGSPADLSELLTILVNETEKTNMCLMRMESRLAAVDAPTAELADATRQAIGMQIRPLASLIFRRAWLLWSDGPTTPACATSQLTSLGLDPKKPLVLMISNEYVYEGLWMLERK